MTDTTEPGGTPAAGRLLVACIITGASMVATIWAGPSDGWGIAVILLTCLGSGIIGRNWAALAIGPGWLLTAAWADNSYSMDTDFTSLIAIMAVAMAISTGLGILATGELGTPLGRQEDR